MDEDHNSGRLLSEPPEFPDQGERAGSMSLGGTPNANGDDVSPINGDTVTSAASSIPVDHNTESVQSVVTSEIGVATLLNRLKQSIASAKVCASKTPLADPS